MGRLISHDDDMHFHLFLFCCCAFFLLSYLQPSNIILILAIIFGLAKRRKNQPKNCVMTKSNKIYSRIKMVDETIYGVPASNGRRNEIPSISGLSDYFLAVVCSSLHSWIDGVMYVSDGMGVFFFYNIILADNRAKVENNVKLRNDSTKMWRKAKYWVDMCFRFFFFFYKMSTDTHVR